MESGQAAHHFFGGATPATLLGVPLESGQAAQRLLLRLEPLFAVSALLTMFQTTATRLVVQSRFFLWLDAMVAVAAVLFPPRTRQEVASATAEVTAAP